MGKKGHSGKPQIQSTTVHHNPITIYKDDHRNNPGFLKRNPFTIVLDRKAEKEIRLAHEHDHVTKHHPATKFKNHHSSVAHPSNKKKKPGENKHIHTDNPDEELLENSQRLFDMDEDTPAQDTEKDGGEFLFHQTTSEENDPISDQENVQNHPIQKYDNIEPKSGPPEINIPTDFYIDQNSFIPQIDAKDGSVTFKASLIFNLDENDNSQDDIGDYDIILTQVTTT